jgi:hypothetical protein
MVTVYQTDIRVMQIFLCYHNRRFRELLNEMCELKFQKRVVKLARDVNYNRLYWTRPAECLI